jgi:hypothetical protein
LYASYPNFRLFRRGYYLRGTNRYHPPNQETTSDRTNLWFEQLGGGAFKQFATVPYSDCHWDLLRWGAGTRGLLVYLATEAGCYSDHTSISFSPGIAYMPKAWVPGQPWRHSGVSRTVYSDNGVPVCAGNNTWSSSVEGLVRMPDGKQAVHTQTNETQGLTPIEGAPESAACPPGQETRFDWQENYYLATPIDLRRVDGGPGGTDVGLARSVGGNPAVIRAIRHPEWDSVFETWEPTPPSDVGTLTTATRSVANGSAGNTIVFTYTAPPRGLQDGVLRIPVPPGWTPPTTTGGPGCTESTGGVVAARGRLIEVSGINLPGGGKAIVSYGSRNGGACGSGGGATAPTNPGAPVWRAELRSPGEPFTSLPGAPAIDVGAADGAGMLELETTVNFAPASSSTLTFVFTATTGGMVDGAVRITVPAGWTAPVTAGASGCTTASAGAVTTSGQTITWSNLTISANTSVALTYGATSGGNCAGGDGAFAPRDPQLSVFPAEEISTSGGSWTPIAESPTVELS